MTTEEAFEKENDFCYHCMFGKECDRCIVNPVIKSLEKQLKKKLVYISKSESYDRYACPRCNKDITLVVSLCGEELGFCPLCGGALEKTKGLNL